MRDGILNRRNVKISNPHIQRLLEQQNLVGEDLSEDVWVISNEGRFSFKGVIHKADTQEIKGELIVYSTTTALALMMADAESKEDFYDITNVFMDNFPGEDIIPTAESCDIPMEHDWKYNEGRTSKIQCPECGEREEFLLTGLPLVEILIKNKANKMEYDRAYRHSSGFKVTGVECKKCNHTGTPEEFKSEKLIEAGWFYPQDR